VRSARCLLAADRNEAALSYLKEEARARPDSGRLQVLLAVAYLRNDNAVWAVRTLVRRVSSHPDDCEALTWLAWSKIRLSLFDDVASLLEGEACLDRSAAATRILLLRSLGAHHAGRHDEAKADIRRAGAQDEAYTADRKAMPSLSRVVDPTRLAELSWWLELSGGATSNALLGTPKDVAIGEAAAGSALLQARTRLRYAADLGGPLRPMVELDPRVLRFFSEQAEELSYVDLSGRAGLILDWGIPRILVAYRPDMLHLPGGDQPGGSSWYFEAHRGELEVELSPYLLVLGGMGRRTFGEMGRTRLEADVGLGGHAPLSSRLVLLWAFSFRKHWATERFYDLNGLTALASVQAHLPARVRARVSASFAVDDFPESAGFFGDAARRDLTPRLAAVAWAPPLWDARLGLGYELTMRDSTVSKYGGSDHRVTLRIGFWGSLDPPAPPASREQALAELRWGVGSGDGEVEERIQDLLRQDESAGAGCGCGP